MTEPKRYFFDLEDGEPPFRDPDGALFPGPDAARTHAEQIVRELKEGGGYDDPLLVLLVKDENGTAIFSIPFVDCH